MENNITAKEIYEMSKNLKEHREKEAKSRINITSTLVICAAIILAGIIFSATYYFVNKDNYRYEYKSGLVIDKKTGSAKEIKIKRN